MGTNKRYADSIDRRMNARITESETRGHAPVSLTNEELELTTQPRVRALRPDQQQVGETELVKPGRYPQKSRPPPGLGQFLDLRRNPLMQTLRFLLPLLSRLAARHLDTHRFAPFVRSVLLPFRHPDRDGADGTKVPGTWNTSNGLWLAWGWLKAGSGVVVVTLGIPVPRMLW